MALRQRSNWKLTVVLLVAFTVFLIVFYHEYQPNVSRIGLYRSSFMPVTRHEKFLNASAEWKSCFSEELMKCRKDPKEMWYWIGIVTEKCRNQTSFSKINMTSVKNKDEIKYHVNGHSEEPSVVLTLGVGLDVKAEIELRRTLPSGSRFYGADPIFKGNSELFEVIGSFFPFAVGTKIEATNALVLKNGTYINSVMPHIDIITFITKFVKESMIDLFLMDNEGPEYDLLPMMARGAEFDRNGIVVCQCNVEVHTADVARKERFLGIMNTIIDDGRYAFLVSLATYHHRIFFVNIEHPICVDKYLSRFFES